MSSVMLVLFDRVHARFRNDVAIVIARAARWNFRGTGCGPRDEPHDGDRRCQSRSARARAGSACGGRHGASAGTSLTIRAP